MRVFITGATGFIGKRLCNALKEKDKAITAVSSRKRDNESVEYIICDLVNEELPSNCLQEVSTIFHLAGHAHDLANSSESKQKYQKLNVRATTRLAKLALKAGVKNFIFVSSTKAALCEDTNSPQGIYGETKREAEDKLLYLCKDSEMCLSIVRPALVYGPGVKGNLSSMIEGIKKGWFPPLPNSSNSRSMVHVDDLVRALLFLEESRVCCGEIYNVTDGQEYSSHQIYRILCFVLGKEVPKWEVPLWFFSIISALSPSLRHRVKKLLGTEVYSSSKLQKIGFKPKFTLKEINETNF